MKTWGVVAYYAILVSYILGCLYLKHPGFAAWGVVIFLFSDFKCSCKEDCDERNTS